MSKRKAKSSDDSYVTRKVTMGVRLNASVEMIVRRRADADPDDEWLVESIIRADLDTPSVRDVTETLDGGELDYLNQLANKAEDIDP